MIPPAAATGTRYGNQASQRVLSILAQFGQDADTRGVTELSRLTGMNKNMIHRALTTLVESGYLVRDRSGERYRLGFMLLNMKVEESMVDFRPLARPTLERLHALIGESVFLSVIVGSNRVNVDWIEGQGRRVSLGQRGRTIPLHVTKMSLVLLAHCRDGEIEAYLAGAGPLGQYDDDYPLTEPTTRESIWREIKDIRGRNYVMWQNPDRFDAAYVCFPIAGLNGTLHGIVTIGGPRERFDPKTEVERGEVVATIERLRQHCASLPAAAVVIGGKAA